MKITVNSPSLNAIEQTAVNGKMLLLVFTTAITITFAKRNITSFGSCFDGLILCTMSLLHFGDSASHECHCNNCCIGNDIYWALISILTELLSFAC